MGVPPLEYALIMTEKQRAVKTGAEEEGLPI
jgi:hypothetical protein